MSAYFNRNPWNCVLEQTHSDEIVFGSNFQKGKKIQADGIVSDKSNQNLWIYTADCMPILIADKRKRFVAAIHCGRRGLERGIIEKLIKIFYEAGSFREDVLVAIGPSISKKNYLLDRHTINIFHKNYRSKILTTSSNKDKNKILLNDLEASREKDLISLDLRKYAHLQLLHENIPNKNIDISSLCTFSLKDQFHSWRRTKTSRRQWNFICP